MIQDVPELLVFLRLHDHFCIGCSNEAGFLIPHPFFRPLEDFLHGERVDRDVHHIVRGFFYVDHFTL